MHLLSSAASARRFTCEATCYMILGALFAVNNLPKLTVLFSFSVIPLYTVVHCCTASFVVFVACISTGVSTIWNIEMVLGHWTHQLHAETNWMHAKYRRSFRKSFQCFMSFLGILNFSTEDILTKMLLV